MYIYIYLRILIFSLLHLHFRSNNPGYAPAIFQNMKFLRLFCQQISACNRENQFMQHTFYTLLCLIVGEGVKLQILGKSP